MPEYWTRWGKATDQKTLKICWKQILHFIFTVDYSLCALWSRSASGSVSVHVCVMAALMVIVHIVQRLEITHNLTNHSSVYTWPITAQFRVMWHPADQSELRTPDKYLTLHSLMTHNRSPVCCDQWHFSKLAIFSSRSFAYLTLTRK